MDIPTFRLFRSDSEGTTYKHGVCAYIHESLLVDKVTAHKPNILSFHLTSYNVYILVIYRPPSSSHLCNKELADFITNFCDGKEVIVVGDFNLPNIDWCDGAGDGTPSTCPPLEKSFLDVFDLLGLTQWIREPTYPRSGNTLDLILTSDPDRVSQVYVSSPLPGCDHCPTLLDYVIAAAPDYPTCVVPHRLSWHKGNYKVIRQNLEGMSWDSLEALNASDAFDYFAEHISDLVKEFVPMKPPHRDKPPWPVRAPTSLIHAKQSAWCNYKAVRGRLGRKAEDTRLAYMSFSEANHNCRTFAVRSQASYEDNLIHRFRENPKILHAYIRQKKVGRPSVGPLQLDSGQLSDIPAEMCECLADAFASVYMSATPSNPAPHQEFEGPFEIPYLSTDIVRSALLRVDESSSVGPDGIHPMLLRQCATQLAQPLTVIFNKSIQESLVPKRWKSSVITPIYKKGIHCDPLNYRPISINSACGKELERIVCEHLREYLESNSLLTEHQFGFRSGRSTTDQLLLVYNEVSKAMDAGAVVDVVLFDFSKAFDVVSHDILLEKLSCLGIKAGLLQWFSSFLRDRQMQVCVAGTTSGVRKVLSGVPQGSVLGPLLFLIYINSIASHLASDYAIFADDLKIFACVSHPSSSIVASHTSRVQADIDILFSTAKSWGLHMNRKKCAAIQFSRRILDPIPPAYFLNGEAIPVVSKHVDLGILIDNQLKFHDHIREVARKASGLAQNFLKSTVSRSPEFMLFLWTTHIRPLIEYGSCIWNTGYLTDLSLLEKVQRRWTKHISGLEELSYADRLQSLNLFSIQGRLLRADLIQYWKVINEKSCIRPDRLFALADHSRTRGHTLKLFLPAVSTDVRSRSFSVRCIQRWNQLPGEVASADCLSAFKKMIHSCIRDDLFAYTE